MLNESGDVDGGGRGEKGCRCETRDALLKHAVHVTSNKSMTPLSARGRAHRSSSIFSLSSTPSSSTATRLRMPPPPKKALAAKESALFKELLNLYETRQLKKGLKTADAILKKFPEHGGMASFHDCKRLTDSFL